LNNGIPLLYLTRKIQRVKKPEERKQLLQEAYDFQYLILMQALADRPKKEGLETFRFLTSAFVFYLACLQSG